MNRFEGEVIEDAMAETVPLNSEARHIQPTFALFLLEVRLLLEPTAAGKGYSTTGIDGTNTLYEFVQEMAGPGHALGEIVYKARRYGAKRNPEDLLKIAAWAFLLWKHHDTSGG